MTGVGYPPRAHNAQAQRKRQFAGASVFAFSGALLAIFALIVPSLPNPGTGPLIALTMAREPAMLFLPLPALYGALLATTGSKLLYSIGQYLVCAVVSASVLVIFYGVSMT